MALLQQQLRAMQTKLMLSRDDVLLLPKVDATAVESEAAASAAIARQVDELAARLHAMHSEAQALVQDLAQAQQLVQRLSPLADTSASNHSTTADMQQAAATKREPTCEDMASAGEIAFDWHAPRILEPIGDEELFEAVASRGTRENGEAQQRLKAEEATRLVHELKHVLDYRKLERHPPSDGNKPAQEQDEHGGVQGEERGGGCVDERASAVTELAWTPRSQPTTEQHSLLSELKSALKASACSIAIEANDTAASDSDEEQCPAMQSAT
ncbi:hypothetical protein SYNPS1DRAFT_23748 [Syncephalis pseudoplumigaleata]|uniref:Uncharacterized protein n=1 Tax=Syncephalis pseudoplumigaleata TaxID=1712513 RepID=A0A4P9YXV1_9FUNG|nr:hypothetical protein SYNPS1DRAFT_23748 [Syncephalis pseudoplumigaleata]|eukprot:RKP24161.1 hypothetical protein SYNPS1DRAFT_23748 [Syncephalis pseudoplumigaleata]